MGQESSIPSRNASIQDNTFDGETDRDETNFNPDPASPQSLVESSHNTESASVSRPSLRAVQRASSSQQQQQQQQQQQPPHAQTSQLRKSQQQQSRGVGLSPRTNFHVDRSSAAAGASTGTASSSSSQSIMSRAGLTSMIQRMGVSSSSSSAHSNNNSNHYSNASSGNEASSKQRESTTTQSNSHQHQYANNFSTSKSSITTTTNHSSRMLTTNAMGSLVNKMSDLVVGDPSSPRDSHSTQVVDPHNSTQRMHPFPPPSQNTTTATTQHFASPVNDEENWAKAWAEDGESDEEEEEDEHDHSEEKALPLTVDEIYPTEKTFDSPSIGLDVGNHSASTSNFLPEGDGGFSQMGGAGVLLEGQKIKLHEAEQGSGGHDWEKQQQLSQQLQLQYTRQHEQEAHLAQEADEVLRKDWDSYPQVHDGSMMITPESERPCVEMFDPALRVLGRGSFGRVVLVQKRYGHGQGSLYAMKILRKSHLVRRRQIERTRTERKVLSMLNHPFLMRLYYAFQTAEKLYLVLDYCPGGELFFHLSRYRRFQEPVARFYAAELLLAIGHLHKHGIIYRDLKPENVLLDAYGHVKLGDFGLAKDGIRHPTQGAKSTCGTPEYMAPEVLNQTGHGFCVDYWGLGMILYEMMTGLPPWYTTDRSKLFRRLRSAPLVFPNEIQFSPHCKACIAGLLERDPRLRLGVLGLRSAMRHEFFYRRINFEALSSCQVSAPIRPCEGWRQFASRHNSGEGYGSDPLPPRGHSAGPSFESGAMGQITAELLDVATENFDDTFRRMPIETEDYERQQQASGHAPITEKELNSQTFRGFTFDGDELLDDTLEDGTGRFDHQKQGNHPHPMNQQQLNQKHYFSNDSGTSGGGEIT